MAKESSDVRKLADYIKSDRCKKIVLMLGAGERKHFRRHSRLPFSRNRPILLQANLARLKLPYPEAVFEINFFRNNPVPFYTLAHELYPGKFRPTLTHSFIRLLAQRNLLHMCFTQNIDTLERRAGVPDDKIIEAHGSFATQRCIDCKRVYDDEKMKVKVLAKETPRCERAGCGGLIKPDIVFFGENLPDEFLRAIPMVAQADLLIVMGTSMTVHPFAGLAERTGPNCPRVLVNLDRVGGIGRRPKDTVLLGKCDAIVLELCQALGWEEELNALWAKTEIKTTGEGEEEADGEEAEAENLVETITDAIERQLNLGDGEAVAKKESEDDVPTATTSTPAEPVAGGPATEKEEVEETQKEAPNVKDEKEPKL
ncbi:NAD-dependent protein deacetylase [Mycena kentingensis (nom. inval.)]|nr:NAD-dependent protein deacetylase [Mycena kentingensis (nom. inval.)]